MDRAQEARVDLAAPFVGRGVGEALADDEAGVVDEDIEAAELGCCAIDHVLDLPEVGDVGFAGDGPTAPGLDLFHDGPSTVTRGVVVDRHGRALGCERKGDRAAHVAGRAGHERDPALKSQLHYRSPVGSFALLTSRNSRSGVTGSSSISMPSGRSASETALATAAGAPMV